MPPASRPIDFELLRLEQLVLGRLSSGDVDDRRVDLELLAGPDRGETDLDRELRPVPSATGQVEPDPHRPCPRVLGEPVAVSDVSFGDPIRQEQLDGPAEQLLAAVAEGHLGLWVRVRDPRARVHGHDRVGRRVEDRARAWVVRGDPCGPRRVRSERSARAAEGVAAAGRCRTASRVGRPSSERLEPGRIQELQAVAPDARHDPPRLEGPDDPAGHLPAGADQHRQVDHRQDGRGGEEQAPVAVQHSCHARHRILMDESIGPLDDIFVRPQGMIEDVETEAGIRQGEPAKVVRRPAGDRAGRQADQVRRRRVVHERRQADDIAVGKDASHEPPAVDRGPPQPGVAGDDDDERRILPLMGDHVVDRHGPDVGGRKQCSPGLGGARPECFGDRRRDGSGGWGAGLGHRLGLDLRRAGFSPPECMTDPIDQTRPRWDQGRTPAGRGGMPLAVRPEG